MAEYKVVFRADLATAEQHDLRWEPLCPVMVTVVQVSRNVQTSQAYLQLKVKNLSATEISSLNAIAAVTYADGKTEEINVDELDADIPATSEKALNPLMLPRADVESVQVSISQVTMPNAKWSAQGETIPIPETTKLPFSAKAMSERQRQLKEDGIDGSALAGYVKDNGDWWVCSCGQVNVNRGSCCSCKAGKADLLGMEDEAQLEESADRWAESVYEEALQLSAAEDNQSLEKAGELFKSLNGWKDSEQKAAEAEFNLTSRKTAASKELRKRIVIAAVSAIVVIFAGVLIAKLASDNAAYNSMPECFLGLQIGDDEAALDAALANLPESAPSGSETMYVSTNHSSVSSNSRYIVIDNAFIGDVQGTVRINSDEGKIITIYWYKSQWSAADQSKVKQALDERYRGSEEWSEPVPFMNYNYSIDKDAPKLDKNVLKYTTGEGQELYFGQHDEVHNYSGYYAGYYYSAEMVVTQVA